MFQDQEPEYTKVRRKGNRLRDPHSESQGMFECRDSIFSNHHFLSRHTMSTLYSILNSNHIYYYNQFHLQ